MIPTYQTPYQPVDPDFHEIVWSAIQKAKSLKVHFFDTQGQVADQSGIPETVEQHSDGWFLIVQNQPIRFDTIITLAGRPGPAYSRYDQFGNACLACEDLGQF